MNRKISFSLICLLICLRSFSQIDSAAVKADSATVNNKLADSTNSHFNIPIFSTSGTDAEADLDQQDVSSLLQSSRDVFVQFASFQFGVARYRIRGYPAENQMVLINGVSVNNPETGFSSWSNWGGLNDVTRYVETRFGVVNNRYGFSGPGGYINIDSKASSFRKGTRLSYANSNRIYRNRFMLTHSTGMMQNGWALTLSASNRSGNEVYIPGTYFNANAFYLSADKRISTKHLVSFTGFVAPIEQGRANAARLEAYELAGTNYYNDLWGYQNGKVRNSRVSKVQRPMLILSHIYTPKKDARLTTSLFYTFGKSRLSSLNWNGAPNPKPDYWRYMPSSFYSQGNSVMGDYLTRQWQTDVTWRQLDWDAMIVANRANLYVLPSQLGQGIVTNETRARYILENTVENLKNIGLNTVYNARIKKIFFSAGLNANVYRNRKYKELEDLLGATYWLDYDQFAQNLGVDPTYQQNNLEDPDKKIYKGDIFGYDYSININSAELWGMAEYSIKKIDVYAGITVSTRQIWREGFMANGKFPTTSKGLSEKMDFTNYGFKGGVTYKLNGRHFLTANGTYFTRTPEVNNLFVSPRVRNDIVKGVSAEKVASLDLNYIVRYPGLKLRLTYYNTQINNQLWLRTYWHDSHNNNVNLIMKGVDQNHEGVEIGLEKTLFTSHVIQGALGYGQFVYTNRPTLEAWQDNNSAVLFENRKVYLKNYRIGGSPQFVSGLGYKYNSKKYWYAGLYFNYFGQTYLEPNPDRRTENALRKYLDNEKAQYEVITTQEQLPDYFVLNFNGGKSFRIRSKYFLAINISVNNLLNNKNNLISGFEQLRWDYGDISRFDNKYYYMTGTTYMAMINFTF